MMRRRIRNKIIVKVVILIVFMALFLSLTIPALKEVSKKLDEMLISSIELKEMGSVDVAMGCAVLGIGDLRKAEIEPVLPQNYEGSYKIVTENLPTGASLRCLDDIYYISWKPTERTSQEIIIITKTKNQVMPKRRIKLEAY